MRTFIGNRYNWDRDTLISMRGRGWGVIRIAKEYGCDHTTVMHAMRRLGISTKETLAPSGGVQIVDWENIASRAGAVA